MKRAKAEERAGLFTKELKGDNMFLSKITKTGGFDEDKRLLLSLISENGYAALAKIVVDMGDSMIPLKRAALYMNMSMDMLMKIERDSHRDLGEAVWAAIEDMIIMSANNLLACTFPNFKGVQAQIEVPEGSGFLYEKALFAEAPLEYTKPDSAYNERQRRADDAFMHIALAHQLSTQLYAQLHVGNRKLLVGYVCAQLELYIDYVRNYYVLIMKALETEDGDCANC